MRICQPLSAGAIALALCAPPAHAGTTEWALPSGLVVLHRPNARFPIVRVVVTVGGGTADTAPGKRPLAHLAEHVAFRADLAGGPAYQTLRAAGCGVNGTTWLDTTVFALECPTDAAELAVGFAVSLATHDFQGLEDEDVVTEARVVLAETTQRLDAGVLVYDEALQGVFTGDHPYRLEERVPEDLLALRRADVDAFFRAHYVPDDVVIAVEGDLDASTLAGLIARAAGDGFAHPRQRRGEIAEWPAGAIPIQWLSPFAATWFRDPEHPDRALESGHLLPKAARTPPPVPEPEPGPRSARHSGTWPQVQVAWYLPPADSHNWVHLGESAVFAEDALRKVFDAEAVIGGGCEAYLGTRGSTLLCSALVETEDEMAAVGRRIATAFQHPLGFREERRLAAADDVDERSWRAVVRRDQQGVEDLGDLSAYRLATGRFNLEGERMKALASGGGSAGWVALRTAWLGPARAVTTMVEPESRAAMVVEGTSAGWDAAQAVRWPAPALGDVAAEQAEETVLENGLRTVVFPLPRADIGAWRLAVPPLPGLEYLEPVVDDLIRTPDRYEGNPLYYNWDVEDDVLAANQQGSWEPRHLLRSLWATVAGLKVTGVPQEFRRLVMSEVYAGRSAYTWIERAWRRATREDPERDGLPEIDEAIRTKGAVEAYLAAKYQPGRSTLLLVGAVDTEARARIAEEMGDWRASTAPPPTLRVARRRAPTPEAIVLDRNGEGRTVSVTWVCPTNEPGATPPDPLTAALLGTLASDRLFDVVRASSGLTYSPMAWTRSRGGVVDLYLRADTELGREGQVLAALRAVGDDLGSGRAGPWLDAARRQVMADELREGASVLGLARTLAAAAVRHGSLADLRASRAALAGVDADRVASLLRACKTAGNAILVGPAEEVAAGLTGGDLPVRVLDWRAEHMALVQRWLPEMQKRETDWLERARRK